MVSIEVLCGVFGKSRQAWYKKQRTVYKQVYEEQLILEHVRRIRKRMPRLGVRKLKVILEEQGCKVGRDALFDILRRNGMLVRRRRYRKRTTWSIPWWRKYPNLVKEINLNHSNQLWVSDMTYVRATNRDLYLFLITDAYSKKIVGYEVAEDWKAKHAVAALKMGLNGLKNDQRVLIHHSDRGIQYCCNEYIKLLRKNKVKISMTENGDPLQNAIAERVNGIIKDEWLYEFDAMNSLELKKIIPKIIHIYNSERPHLSLDMNTPIKVYGKNGKINKRWKNYYGKKNWEKMSRIVNEVIH